MSTQINLLIPTGPVARRFYADNSGRGGIMGPVGSGKTTAIIARIIRHAMEQDPHPQTGERVIRVVCVRQTYRQLWKTTIQSWWKAVPKDFGAWVGAAGNPATHDVTFALPAAGGGSVDFRLIMEFMAIGDQDYEEALRGYEATIFWLNEVDTLDPGVYNYCRGRIGRFPGRINDPETRERIFGPTYSGVLMDFNAPDDLNWVAEKIVYSEESGVAYFEQPPAIYPVDKAPFPLDGLKVIADGADRYVVNPGAENLENLEPGYYADQITGNAPDYIKRMLGNVPTPSKHGRPVFERDFRPEFHVAAGDIEAVWPLKLIIGADAGRTPAALIGQLMPTGQARWYDEFIMEGVSAREFAGQLLAFVTERYNAWVKPDSGRPMIDLYGDPSSIHAPDASEKSWLDIVRDVTGWDCRPAPLINNNLQVRLDSVSHYLRFVPEPGVPGLLIGRRLKAVRRAFASGYQFQVIKVGEGRHSTEPIKDKHSHIMDAGQYWCVGSGAADLVMRGDAAGRDRAPLQTRARDDGSRRERRTAGGQRQRQKHARG